MFTLRPLSSVPLNGKPQRGLVVACAVPLDSGAGQQQPERPDRYLSPARLAKLNRWRLEYARTSLPPDAAARFLQAHGLEGSKLKDLPTDPDGDLDRIIDQEIEDDLADEPTPPAKKKGKPGKPRLP